jgi:chromosome partitioning protein
MEIVCPNCQRKRTIDASKLPAGNVTVRCEACDHRFTLKSARRLSVMITKGGVGKTTTAVTLASGLALNGYKVLLVDTDTQGQTSYMMGLKSNDGLAKLLLGEKDAGEAVLKARENLWLLAGGKSLASVKRMITRMDYGGERTLTNKLQPLEKSYDFIILDTSPSWDTLTVNVLFYARELIVPVSLEIMPVQGLAEFLKSFSQLRAHNKDIRLRYILPLFLAKPTENSRAILRSLEKYYGKYICTPIRYSTRISEAPAYGMTIFEYAGGDKVVQDYKDLVREVLKGDEI